MVRNQTRVYFFGKYSTLAWRKTSELAPSSVTPHPAEAPNDDSNKELESVGRQTGPIPRLKGTLWSSFMIAMSPCNNKPGECVWCTIRRETRPISVNSVSLVWDKSCSPRYTCNVRQGGRYYYRHPPCVREGFAWEVGHPKVVRIVFLKKCLRPDLGATKESILLCLGHVF